MNQLLCAYHTNPHGPFNYVTNSDIITAVRTAIKPSKAAKYRYHKGIVGSHSLCSGGAMALFNQGVDTTTIMKLGQWTSTTFMMYIHKQVDTISQGASAKMAVDSPFVNLGA